MKSVVVALAALVMFLPDAVSQLDRSKILAETNVGFLTRFALEKEIEFTKDKNRADSMALVHGWPLTLFTSDSIMIELVDVSPNGKPIYYLTDNDDAALTTRTNRVHNGGGAGLNLEGQDMTIAIWDGGGVRTTHEQFSGRATKMDAAADASHATHVAGTMVGDGNPNPGAKGMAPQADIESYNWTNDESEMAAAAADGLLVSNHSYGTATGWLSSGGTLYWYGDSDYSTTEAHYFGKYEYSARDWDQIAENAPYYLIVKSAGNDRNDYAPSSGSTYTIPGEGTFNTADDPRPTDCDQGNGWDCLPTRSSAKNVMVVAAVNDVNSYTGPGSVNMTSFSGWGPTDDGRIKPDISANGASLYSSGKNSNTHYYSSSGTSMSSPNISGSCILLQQHYEDLHGQGNFMRSSTLRALVCHTADECGPDPGPDYMYGWGLMNTEKAALQIGEDMDRQNAVMEYDLLDGDTFSLHLHTDGTLPLKVTIAWVDPAASATVSGNDDPTCKLINDLDVRMIDENQITYKPYILDPANPANAATTGDNARDNIEQIYLANPVEGPCTIVVSHKGSLNGGSQNFSMILSGSFITPCQQDTIDLTGVPVVEEGLYKAATMVTIDGEVSDQVELEAGGAILLNPGFTIGNQNEFRAEISSCAMLPPSSPLSLPMIERPIPVIKPLKPLFLETVILFRRDIKG